MAAPVAPFESCIACLKGDTATGLLLEGEPEWIIATLQHVVDLPLVEAKAAMQTDVVTETPGGRIRMGLRLCHECAAKAGVEVTQADARVMASLVQLGSDE